MPLDKLKSLVVPPSEPLETGNSELWEQVETHLNIRFPDDYKLCIDTYGTGYFSGFLFLINPFWKNFDYFAWVQSDLEGYISTKTEFPEQFPFPVYPQAGGLYPWATTIDGETLYWQTKGTPENWPIIIYPPRAREFERWNISVSGFLFQWLSGDMKSTILPTKNLEKIFTSEF